MIKILCRQVRSLPVFLAYFYIILLLMCNVWMLLIKNMLGSSEMIFNRMGIVY